MLIWLQIYGFYQDRFTLKGNRNTKKVNPKISSQSVLKYCGSLLHLQIICGQPLKISGPDDPNLKKEDDWGMTPLMLAVRLGLLEIVKHLIEQGADPNYISQINNETAGANALKVAIFYGKQGRSVLMEAIIQQKLGLVTFLLENRTDPNFLLPKNRFTESDHGYDRLVPGSTCLWLAIYHAYSQGKLTQTGIDIIKVWCKMGYKKCIWPYSQRFRDF